MISRAAIPYEKVVLVAATLKMPLAHVPQDITTQAFNLCVQRAGGLPQGLNYDPPVFTKKIDPDDPDAPESHALRVRFHGQADSYIDTNRVVASMSSMYDGFSMMFMQQNSGMVIG